MDSLLPFLISTDKSSLSVFVVLLISSINISPTLIPNFNFNRFYVQLYGLTFHPE